MKIESLNRTFASQIQFKKLEKEVLIIFPNLKYTELIDIYEHYLIGIQMNERDTKPELPIYMEESEYRKINMRKYPKINEAVAEETKWGVP